MKTSGDIDFICSLLASDDDFFVNDFCEMRERSEPKCVVVTHK